jgi:hypothetical protein
MTRQRGAEFHPVVFVAAFFASQKMRGDCLPLFLRQFMIEVCGKFFLYVFLHFYY